MQCQKNKNTPAESTKLNVKVIDTLKKANLKVGKSTESNQSTSFHILDHQEESDVSVKPDRLLCTLLTFARNYISKNRANFNQINKIINMIT